MTKKLKQASADVKTGILSLTPDSGILEPQSKVGILSSSGGIFTVKVKKAAIVVEFASRTSEVASKNLDWNLDYLNLAAAS